jgi:polar amino acid transport system substrate-binding protein
MTDVQQATDPRVADLVQAGKVRVALYLPQYTKDLVTGELGGWCVDLISELGERLGVAGVPVENPNPAEAIACLKTGACDAAILGILASRSGEVDFSSPFVEADYTCLVPAGSSIRSVADADRPETRIAAVRNHASTLALSGLLKHASLVYADTPNSTFEILRGGNADLFASLREVLLGYSTQLPGSRVLKQRYGFNSIGIAVPKGQAGRLAYLTEFVEQAKASGLVQRALDRAGWRGIRVAPLGVTSGHRAFK